MSVVALRPPNRLRRFRLASPWTASELGRLLNVDAETVWDWEGGKRVVPDNAWTVFAEVFGVQIRYLRGES